MLEADSRETIGATGSIINSSCHRELWVLLSWQSSSLSGHAQIRQHAKKSRNINQQHNMPWSSTWAAVGFAGISQFDESHWGAPADGELLFGKDQKDRVSIFGMFEKKFFLIQKRKYPFLTIFRFQTIVKRPSAKSMEPDKKRLI